VTQTSSLPCQITQNPFNIISSYGHREYTDRRFTARKIQFRKIARPILKALKEDIKEFGLIDPIIVNSDMTVIGGRRSIKPASNSDSPKSPAFCPTFQSPGGKALNLALNKSTGDLDRTKPEKVLREIESIPAKKGDVENVCNAYASLTIVQPGGILSEREELTLVGFVFYLLIALAIVAVIFGPISWIKEKKDGR
jgi:hypothetical protein